MVVDSEALLMPCANYFPGRHGHKPRWIIVHGTAGGSSAQGIASFFKGTEGGNSPVSSNYVVGPDGTIVCCVAEENGSWANGYISGVPGEASPGNGQHDSWWDGVGTNVNNVTITIEFVKPDSNNATPLTPEQEAAGYALVRRICQRWGIPCAWANASGGVTGHFSIDALYRARCPGTFDWNKLFSGGDEPMIINIDTPGVSDFFKEVAPDRWRCKNGFDVAYGMLGGYRSYGASGLCGLTFLGLPTGGEVYDPDGVVWQPFERGKFYYDPARLRDRPLGATGDCYAGHIEDLYKQPDVEALKKQLEEAQTKLSLSIAGHKQIVVVEQKMAEGGVYDS